MSKLLDMSSSTVGSNFDHEENVIPNFFRKFKGREGIPGILGNIVFFAHGAEFPKAKLVKDLNEVESDDEEEVKTPEGLNEKAQTLEEFESELIIKLCRHFFLNNVNPDEFQIVSNAKTCLLQLGERIKNLEQDLYKFVTLAHFKHPAVVEAKEDSKRLMIVLLSSSGSPDDEIEYYTTLFQSLRCAKLGVLIIGSLRLFLEIKDSIWKILVDSLYRAGCVLPYLPIHCSIHNISAPDVKCPKDIQKLAPMGGCQNICRDNSCGHECLSICHIFDSEHVTEEYRCKKRCQLKCDKNHPCRRFCWELCECQYLCKFSRPCGHLRKDKKKCRDKCSFTFPCGHDCKNECWECDELVHKTNCIKPCSKPCKRGLHKCDKHPCSTPCLPCNEVIDLELKCGHSIRQECWENDPSTKAEEAEEYICQKPCKRGYPMCGHPCYKLCYEECGVCEAVYERPHPVCKHLVRAQCGMRILDPCRTRVKPHTPSKCGHDVLVSCYRARTITAEEVAGYCDANCFKSLDLAPEDCGHFCLGKCDGCWQGRFHERCSHPCGKILICGHECAVPCPAVCPPCTNSCLVKCEHYECPYECGVPCDFKCQEPCPYNCPHLQCSKTCSEICDRSGCVEPCPELLSCGHPCVGFCGEICPDACKICSPQKLNDFVGNSLDENARYLFISSCGHTVDEQSLSTWLNIQGNGQIKLKTCPQCLGILPLTFRRYSKAIRESWDEVDNVRRILVGSDEEMKEIMDRVRKEIDSIMANTEKKHFDTDFLYAILDEASIPIKADAKIGNKHFESMYLDRAKFMDWVFSLWKDVGEAIYRAGQLWEEPYVKTLRSLYSRIFDMLCERDWPFHPNEIHALGMELTRIRDWESLCDRIGSDVDILQIHLANSTEGKRRFQEAEEVIFRWEPYTQKLQNLFKERFQMFNIIQRYTLEITEKERVEIVQAFGSRAGRWFKCRNGHVYVVTECGGVTEVGVCNECGDRIGGENHQLMKTNQLASEMDGAQEPMYPTAMVWPN